MQAFGVSIAGVSAMYFILKYRDKPFFDKIKEVTEEAHKFTNLSRITLEDTKKIAKALEEFENSQMYKNYYEVVRHDYAYGSPERVVYNEFSYLADIVQCIKSQYDVLSMHDFEQIKTPRELVDFIDTHSAALCISYRRTYHTSATSLSKLDNIISKIDKYTLVKEKLEKHKDMYSKVSIDYDKCLCDHDVYLRNEAKDNLRMKCAGITLWKLA